VNPLKANSLVRAAARAGFLLKKGEGSEAWEFARASGGDMVSTVKTRPNHYETLGLKPDATSSEIARAFAREMSVFRPRAFGGLADVTVAYETLRDPARRRAYDESLGLTAMPKLQLSQTLTARVGQTPLQRPFVATLPEPPAAVDVPPPVQPEPPVERKPTAEPQPTPFIAARLRDIASPAPLGISPTPRPDPIAPPGRPEEAASTPPPPPSERMTADGLYDGFGEADHAAMAWKRPALIAGGVVLVVGLFGAWAGWTAGNAIEPEQPKQVAKVSLSPPTELPDLAEAPAPSVPAVRQALVQPTRRVPPVARTQPPRQPAIADAQRFDVTIPGAQAEPAIAQASEAPAEVVAASLPLPNRVIARTIEKIGYACGEVASTSSGGAPGVFKVTCTSGHSYRASPVRGRYHFRRMGGG
jgi:hypothetical protein